MIPSLSPLPTLAITGVLVWGLFVFVVILWVIATLVLEYHWKSYALGEQKISRVRLLYRTGSFFFLAIIFLSVLSYSLS